MMRYSCTLLFSLVLACSRPDGQQANVQSTRRDSVGQQALASVSQPSADTQVPYCSQEPGALRVSEDSIGPLDLGTNLKSLRTVCPGARDTLHYGEHDAYPSLVFHFKGLTAVATQWQDSLLPSQPADVWLVLGENGLLYGRLALSAPWAVFRNAFGAGIAHGGGISIDEHKVTVMFCAHPRMFFDFDAPANSVEEGQSPDLSRIPSDARLKDVAFFPRPNPTWHC
jgi:hypothetical protein